MWVVVEMALALLLPAALASAQEGPWSGFAEDKWKSTITPSMIDLMVESLSLDPDQAIIAQALYDAHCERFAAFCVSGREVEREANLLLKDKDRSDPYGQEAKREAILRPFADEQAALDETLLQSIHALLHPTQVERWIPCLERINRMRYGGRAMTFPEEMIDLVALVEAMELAEADVLDAARFDMLMDEYSRRLNAALLARHAFHVESGRHEAANARRLWLANQVVNVLDENGVVIDVVSPDPECGLLKKARHRQHGELLRALRDVNRTYLSLIANVLNPEQSATLKRRYVERLVEWKPLPAETYAESVLGLELEEWQRLQVDQLLAVHRRWLRDYRLGRNERYDRMGELNYSLGSSWPERQRVIAERDAIEALDQERLRRENGLLAAVLDVLTPEQEKAAPPPTPWPLDE